MARRDAERRDGEQSGSRFIDAVLQVVRNCLRVTGTKYACGVAKRGVGSVRARSVMVVPTVTTLSRILPFQFPVSPTRKAAGPRRVEVWRTRVSVPTGRLFLKQVGYAVPIVDQAHFGIWSALQVLTEIAAMSCSPDARFRRSSDTE